MSSDLRVIIKAMRYPGADRNLIEDMAFRVPANTFVSFVGRSGVGKTTLLRIIAGLEHRFDGEVLLNGGKIVRPTRDVRMVFQDFRLLPWKTVYQNVAFAHNGGPKNGEIDRWLDIVGLLHRKDEWPKNLSGGEQGRVAFARAFIDSPKLLLLDEPFRGLDLATKFELQDEFLRDLRAHPATVILVSHDIEDAVFLSDRVFLLSDTRMRVAFELDVDVPRPRRRADAALIRKAYDLSQRLCAISERNDHD